MRHELYWTVFPVGDYTLLSSWNMIFRVSDKYFFMMN